MIRKEFGKLPVNAECLQQLPKQLLPELVAYQSLRKIRDGGTPRLHPYPTRTAVGKVQEEHATDLERSLKAPPMATRSTQPTQT